MLHVVVPAIPDGSWMHGRDPVEPLARDGVTSSAKKDLKQLRTTLTEASNIALDRTRGRSTPLLLVPSPRPRGKSLSE